MTAVAYINDIILGTSGDLLERGEQRKAIETFAETRGIEISEWFEDEAYEERIRSRPGIRRMLEWSPGFDHVLVERFWALSPLWRELEAFLAECRQRGIQVESVRRMDDGISKMAEQFAGGFA